jgi:Protein of unknown function (DUF2786)
MSADIKVIRKIAALLARGEDAASTPAEMEVALRLAHKLMQEHNLSRDEVRLRKEEMARQDHAVPREDTPYLNRITFAIARLTQTRCALTNWQMRPDEFTFRGLRVDVEYAGWLLRACMTAQKQGWSAYQASPAHAELIAKAASRGAIHRSFMEGFSADLTRRIKQLAASDAAVADRALIVLKDELIDLAFGADAQEKRAKSNPVAITADLAAAFKSGASCAGTVRIRQEISETGAPAGHDHCATPRPLRIASTKNAATARSGTHAPRPAPLPAAQARSFLGRLIKGITGTASTAERRSIR